MYSAFHRAMRTAARSPGQFISGKVYTGATMIEGPLLNVGPPVWKARQGLVEIRFVGRGEPDSLSTRVAKIAGAQKSLATLDQVHSARIRTARAGICGPGDGLVTSEENLVCAVVTADCVPVLLAGDRGIAAVHAGWRGLVAGVLSNALHRIGESPDRITAWIGPAIRGCCYEVGEDVASEISEATGSRALYSPERERPHIDLVDATRRVLLHQGLDSVHSVACCTHCRPDLLYSYRREGPGAGRNVALVWRSED
jgi:YfiH family protein